LAKIIGNVVPADDYTHELGPEPNFNESMYFNFFDTKESLGGFVRLGNRANEGQAEMTVCLYLPDGRVLFSFKRAPIDDNAAFDAGGLRFEVIEPSEQLRTVYVGSAIELAEPRDMADPRKAFAENERVKIRLDLEHTAVGPMYGQSHSGHEDIPADQQFAKAHYEQHMHVTGKLRIGEREHAIDGYGLRDHSWGPRYWQAIHSYQWLTMNFGADLGAMVSVIQRDAAGDKVRRGGVLIRGDELVPIVDAQIEADYDDNGLYHTHVRARIQTQEGETHEIEGEVQGFIPLRNRREGLVTHIGEGMTRWRLGDRVGYGLSEFLRQV